MLELSCITSVEKESLILEMIIADKPFGDWFWKLGYCYHGATNFYGTSKQTY